MPKSKHRKSKVHYSRKLSDKRMEDQVRNFWCADGTMLPRMISRSRDRTVALPKHTITKILKAKYDWQVMVIVFCQSPDEKYYKVDVIDGSQSGTIKELSPSIMKMCDRLIKEQNSRHFISYAWWASPAGDIDLAAMELELVRMLEAEGAYNAEYCNANMVIRFSKP